MGLILVGSGRRGVEILEEPVPYRPRPAKLRTQRLNDEFARRVKHLDRVPFPRPSPFRVRPNPVRHAVRARVLVRRFVVLRFLR